MKVREAVYQDLSGLLRLYTHLHEKSIPESGEKLDNLWSCILADENYHIIVAEENGEIVSSCTLLIVPNLTHSLTPYALIENVVTHADFRKRGFGGVVLAYAKKLSEAVGCYKIMLMTGSKEESTLRFYENAGFSRESKTAFNQKLRD